MGKSDNKAK